MHITKEQAEAFHFPRWEELPSLSLYMDQVLIVVEEALGIFRNESEPLVTATMVNNYVKQNMILAPEKKKYGREQIAQLLVISVLKKVFSMQELSLLFSRLTDAYGVAAAYNLFADKMERGLHGAFSQERDRADAGWALPLMLESAQAALMGKLQVQVLLGDALRPEKEKSAKKKEEKLQAKKKQEKTDAPVAVSREKRQ